MRWTSTQTGFRLHSIHSRATVRALAALLLLAASANAQKKPVKPAEEIKRLERRIVVSIPDRKLALLEDGRVVKIYTVAVGAPDTPTPTGVFHIASRLKDPTWYWPHLVVPPGKDNPLGTRWMGLGKTGFGIHGTNVPASIGKAASHGCIRMGRRDVEVLFAKMGVGDVVEFHGEPSAELAQIFDGEMQASAPRGDAPQVAALTSVSADRARNCARRAEKEEGHGKRAGDRRTGNCRGAIASGRAVHHLAVPRIVFPGLGRRGGLSPGRAPAAPEIVSREIFSGGKA